MFTGGPVRRRCTVQKLKHFNVIQVRTNFNNVIYILIQKPTTYIATRETFPRSVVIEIAAGFIDNHRSYYTIVKTR